MTTSLRTFIFVEEYLEIIAGFRNPASNKLFANWDINSNYPFLHLARYDVRFINTTATITASGNSLTERQGELVCKLILKYKRQLLENGIDVSPVTRPTWRQPLRIIDYNRLCYVDDSYIILQFPFISELIDELRIFSNKSHGTSRWNKDKKVWEIEPTPFNIKWCSQWAAKHAFSISDEMLDYMSVIQKFVETEFKIELTNVDGTYTINNAHPDLISYIENNLGGFSEDNLKTLVDYSSVLGYTVQSDILERFSHLDPFISNLEVKIPPYDNKMFDKAIDYAIATNRFPVVIFEPGLHRSMYERLHQRFGNEVTVLGSRDTIPKDCRFIYINSAIAPIEKIPLLISSHSMMFGGSKQYLVQQSEKIIYRVAEIFKPKL